MLLLVVKYNPRLVRDVAGCTLGKAILV